MQLTNLIYCLFIRRRGNEDINAKDKPFISRTRLRIRSLIVGFTGYLGSKSGNVGRFCLAF